MRILKWPLAIAGAIIAIFLMCLLSVRFLNSPRYLSDSELNISSKVAFGMSVQTNEMRFNKAGLHIRAFLTWVDGTNLFLTNRHVLDDYCLVGSSCRFEIRDATERKFKARWLTVTTCFLGQDVCALTPQGEVPQFEPKDFAAANVGDRVLYLDSRRDEIRFLSGEVERIEGETITVNGYSRNGLSGTPVFNRDGKLIGLVTSIGEPSVLGFMHFLVFGWSQSRSAKLTALANSSWISASRLPNSVVQ